MKKHLTVIFVAFLLLGLAIPSAMASSEYDEGYDRSVELEVTNGTNYTTTANVSAPEEISENHTWSAEVEYNVTDGTDTYETKNWLNVTLSNDSTSTSFSSGEFVLSENGTVNVHWDSDFEVQENITVELTLENDDGQTDTWTGTADVVSNSVYAIRDTMAIITQLIPIIVILAVVLPIIVKLMRDIGDEF